MSRVTAYFQQARRNLATDGAEVRRTLLGTSLFVLLVPTAILLFMIFQGVSSLPSIIFMVICGVSMAFGVLLTATVIWATISIKRGYVPPEGDLH